METYLKRTLDIVFSLLFISLFSPLFLIIAILIKIDSNGPVFFLQKRCGKDGKEFNMYKFRTMVRDAEFLKNELKNEMDGPMFKVKNDPRVTHIGKALRRWSFDELPQFLNVLKGDMSLVGPRPLADDEMSGYNNWKQIRLSVKPGVTGLWQTMGRTSGKFSDWINYDIEYVKKRTLLMDLKILILTVIAVIRNTGA